MGRPRSVHRAFSSSRRARPSLAHVIILCVGLCALCACKSTVPAAADLRQEDDQRAAADQLTTDSAPGADLVSRPDLTRADGALDLSQPPPDLVPPCVPDMTDTQNDPRNCGACGNVCAAGNLCCAGVCRDPQSDPSHCRTCGHSCGTNACCGGLCTSLNTQTNCGGCGISCAAGQSCCAGSCTNQQTDVTNCGGCGIACGTGQVCAAGRCYALDGGLPDMSGPGCLNGGKTPPAVCLLDRDTMSGAGYTICRADCISAWVHHADPGGGTFAHQTICQRLGYTKAAQWGGTCGDICGYCQGKVTSCKVPGNEKYDGGGMCGADCLQITVMWQCVM